jgi:hypothetical protein
MTSIPISPETRQSGTDEANARAPYTYSKTETTPMEYSIGARIAEAALQEYINGKIVWNPDKTKPDTYDIVVNGVKMGVKTTFSNIFFYNASAKNGGQYPRDLELHGPEFKQIITRISEDSLQILGVISLREVSKYEERQGKNGSTMYVIPFSNLHPWEPPRYAPPEDPPL